MDTKKYDIANTFHNHAATAEYKMKLALCLLFAACGGRSLDVSKPCCAATSDGLICRDNACPELQAMTECTTLADAHPTYCQVPHGSCVPVYLETAPDGRPFQTVYCTGE